MRWKDRRQSEHVEDRRHLGGRRLALGGGLGTILILLVAVFFGLDPTSLLGLVPDPTSRAAETFSANDPREEELRQFISVVLADTEDVWNELLDGYREPTLVLFRDRVDSACGLAGSAVGPFYCPGDEKVYIDLSFFHELRSRLGAPGDFAQAYVLAHEIGHHVQNLLGTMDHARTAQARASEEDANRISVGLELQADFYAGVWAHHAARKGLLEPGDVEEALNAASAIGDDRLQLESQGYVVPDSFTHGTSEQRLRSFRSGLESGDFRRGDELVR